MDAPSSPRLPAPPRRIALLKPSALGDIVHALPALTALRTLFPDAHLAWVVNRQYAELLEGHPHLDAVLPFDRGAARRGWWAGLAGFVGFLRELRRARFDLVLDLQGLLRSGLMALWSGAARTVGLGSAREGARWCYRQVVPVPTADMHAVDRYWLAVEALGGGHLPKRFVLPVEPRAAAWARRQLHGWPRPWLMVNLGTRWETKRWPVAHFAAVVGAATARHGGTAVLVGGPDEAPLGAEMAGLLQARLLNLVGATTLRQLVAVLAEADGVLSNDSGPLHIADALGRPVVAPFTCTSPTRTGPYNSMHGAVCTRVACAASYLKTCARMDCMRELTPDRLLPAVEGMLARWQRRSA